MGTPFLAHMIAPTMSAVGQKLPLATDRLPIVDALVVALSDPRISAMSLRRRKTALGYAGSMTQHTSVNSAVDRFTALLGMPLEVEAVLSASFDGFRNLRPSLNRQAKSGARNG
jgi:hypothetical protein